MTYLDSKQPTTRLASIANGPFELGYQVPQASAATETVSRSLQFSPLSFARITRFPPAFKVELVLSQAE